MDERKENETQVELESSANADPLSDELKADRDSGALEDIQKEAESEPSIIAPESPDDLSEDESGSETADGLKTEPKVSKIEATDQQAEDGSETAEVSEGQGAEKNDGSESDVSDTEDAATSQKADESDGDRQIADAESKDTDSPTVTESDDENLSDDDKAGPAQEEKDSLLSKTDSDQKSENDNLTKVEPDGTSEPAVSKTSSKDEEKDSAGEEQEDTENDNTEKNPSEQQSDDPEGETEDLPELDKKKTPLVKAALASIVVAAVFSGFFVFENKSNINSVRESKSKEVENAVTSEASSLKTKPTIQPDDPNYIYNAKIKEISMLKEMLLRKKEEIAQLKKQYQDGIAELEKEILDEMRSAETDTFLQALENKRIEFGLRTIQRRNAYVRQLNQPSEWIYRACEELLYLKRRALVDLQVAEVASGMDMNMHMRHMNTALEKYRPTADRLAVDMKDAQLESLEEIWEQIQTRNLQPSNWDAAHHTTRNTWRLVARESGSLSNRER